LAGSDGLDGEVASLRAPAILGVGGVCRRFAIAEAINQPASG
jgi:hypothetical protein